MSAWRYYAQRILGGAWLDRDLELYDVEITLGLSGPGAMSAKVDPILARQVALDGLMLLTEWSTAVYAEEDGEIRWGGLLHSSAEEEGGIRSLEFIGFSGYPKGRVYEGDGDDGILWIPDAFDIVRKIWAFVQNDPYSNLGLVLSENKSGYYLGDPVKGPKPVQSDYETVALYDAAVVEWTNYAGQAYTLAWWNSTDCGDEIDNIMAEAAGWYLESHSWANTAKTAVNHRITLGMQADIPRRTTLRFVEGENIAVPPYAKRDGDAYGTHVLALGAGEERFMLRRERGIQPEGILRRDKVVSAKDVMTYARLEKMAQDELVLAQDIVYFDSFEVFDHPNAPIGSFQAGDEILVQTFSGFEQIFQWVRIAEYKISPDAGDTVGLTVTRL